VPLNVAVSWTVPPKSTLDADDSVAIVGGTQVLNAPRAKSFSCALVDEELRVSARKLPKHGAVPSNSDLRLMPPS
jgi:hypothetical protein